MNGESNNPQRSLEQISRHAEAAGSSLELSETSASIEGIFYRSCNFCGGAQFRVFKSLDTPFPERIYGDRELTFPEIGRQLKLQYLECSRCGLIGVNPLTRFADINRNSFDGERNIVAWADLDYREYEADKLNEIGFVYDQYEFEKYRETNRILDVSCGPGVSLKWLRDEKGWEVFGIDPDRHSVRMAWDRYGVRIENGLIHDIGAPDEYFDIIIMDNSLEHTFDPNSTLLKIFRLLRKGGGVFIFTPNSHGLSTRYLDANAHWGRWFLFNPKALCLFLKRVGYKVSKLCAIQNPINPALIDKGVGLSSYREGLAVSLIGEEDVLVQVESVRCYSDFFNLMATKPNDANIGSHAENELSLLAGSSLIENKAVNIGPGSITVGDVDRTELDIRSGVEEGEKPALVETQVEVVGPGRGGVFAETLDGCLRTKEHLVTPPSQFRASRNQSLAGLRVIKMLMSVAFRHPGNTIAKFNLVNLKKLIHAVKNTDQAWLEAKLERQVSGAASTPMRAETAEFFEARRCQSVEIQNPQCGPSSEEESDPSSVGIFYRACNFCGASEFRVFKALELQFPERIYGDVELTYPDVGRHLKLQYLECTSCGLVGINPLTRFSDINRNSFDGERNIVAWADLNYAQYESDKLNQIRLVYDHFEFEKYRETNRILDVSCGPGVSLKWLRDEKGWEVFGIDPDRHSVRMAWDRYGVRIENGLIHDIGAPDEYFDIIIMDNSLEHTFDPNSTLLRTFRLLRKGGGFILAVPNSHGLATRYLDANAHWGHWFLYSPKILHDFLSSIGFRVIRINGVQESVDRAIIDRGYDIEPYRESLGVFLADEGAVAAQIGKIPIYSDYFQLMAVKPIDSGMGAERESTLLEIARSSLEQRQDVSFVRESSISSSQLEIGGNGPATATEAAEEKTAPPQDASIQVLISEATRLKSPWVLNLGARNVRGSLGVDCRSWFKDVGKFVGVDLEPGPGVDLVADASSLSRVIRPGSFDIVVSISVFEHLRRPWQVALEINKVLRAGGLVFIHSHQTFPLHDYPGDFFRFSEEAFRELFSEDLGFEVLATGSQGLCRVVPLIEVPGWLVDHKAYINTTVCARKVADFDPKRYHWGDS